MSEIKRNEVYTREEAENLLKISRSTMMRLIKTNIIYAAKVGGQYRILGSELLRLFLPDTGYEMARKVYYKGKSTIQDMEKSLELEEEQSIQE